MIQKIKQIPFTVIVSVIFVVFALVVVTITDPVMTFVTLFLIALGAAVVRIVAYTVERLD